MTVVKKKNSQVETLPLLSICIPTYNRRDRMLSLVGELLSVDGLFEICVHVDGSTDGTMEALAAIEDVRLRTSEGVNQGRASALISACRAARGRFIMVFDDDDALYREGLHAVLADCAIPLPDGVVGYIYHLEGQDGSLIGCHFPVPLSNFLALRADNQVRGDKKEVVLSEALHQVAYDGGGCFRRVPTSLLWSRLAIDFNVICRNIVIGRKVYLPGGMTASVRENKSRNAYPMTLLYVSHIKGFFCGRYRSLTFFSRAVTGAVIYGVQAAITAVLHGR